MTYLTKEDWTTFLVPKISDDISFSAHLKQNIKIQNAFILLISKILNSSSKNLSRRILLASMIYYHKYIITNNISFSDLSSLDKLVLFSSCIFLAFKVENKLIDIKVISNKFQNLFNKFKHFEIEEIKELIIKQEFEILLSLEFNISIDWPYELIKLLIIYLKKMEKSNETITKIINYVNLNINDSILFPLCLYYTPNEIAFSCILLAKEKYKFDFINITDLIKLNQYQVDNEQIKECSLYISKIIQFKENLIANINANNKLNININLKEQNNMLDNIKEKCSLNLNNLALINTNTN